LSGRKADAAICHAPWTHRSGRGERAAHDVVALTRERLTECGVLGGLECVVDNGLVTSQPDDIPIQQVLKSLPKDGTWLVPRANITDVRR
jgi:hypothetical protein